MAAKTRSNFRASVARAAPVAGAVADAGRLLRGAIRSGGLGAVVEAAIGTVEGAFGVFDGKGFDAAGRHVARKAAGGFVVGTVASLAAEAAMVILGPGVPALIGGVLGGAAAAKLWGRLLGPSPLDKPVA
jgi:hypothetical protein